MTAPIDLDVKQLIAMQARGLSIKAIARELGVSGNTVRKYIERLPRDMRRPAEVSVIVRDPKPAPPSWKPVSVPVPPWEQEAAAKRVVVSEPRPVYQGESRLRAKLNARRQEQEVTG